MNEGEKRRLLSSIKSIRDQAKRNLGMAKKIDPNKFDLAYGDRIDQILLGANALAKQLIEIGNNSNVAMPSLMYNITPPSGFISKKHEMESAIFLLEQILDDCDNTLGILLGDENTPLLLDFNTLISHLPPRSNRLAREIVQAYKAKAWMPVIMATRSLFWLLCQDISNKKGWEYKNASDVLLRLRKEGVFADSKMLGGFSETVRYLETASTHIDEYELTAGKEEANLCLSYISVFIKQTGL